MTAAEVRGAGRRPSEQRGQANLLAVGVALLLVTGALGVAVAFSDGAFAGVDRTAGDRRLADSLAARVVASDGPLAARENVLRRDAVENLTPASFEDAFPAARGHAVRVALDGHTLVRTGDATGGETVRRIVLVARRQSRTYAPAFGAGVDLTLPRRTGALDLVVRPPPGTVVRTVRADGRIVLRDPDGLRGAYRVRVSRYRTTTVAVDANGSLPAGSVRVTAHPSVTEKATLAVTVDG